MCSNRQNGKFTNKLLRTELLNFGYNFQTVTIGNEKGAQENRDEEKCFVQYELKLWIVVLQMITPIKISNLFRVFCKS